MEEEYNIPDETSSTRLDGSKEPEKGEEDNVDLRKDNYSQVEVIVAHDVLVLGGVHDSTEDDGQEAYND